MSADMRSFASAAHAALDEKERMRSRLRRMRHEYRAEKATAESEMLNLLATQSDLERMIEAGEADEEAYEEAETIGKVRAMRAAYAAREELQLRSGYLAAQLEALVGEFRQLGEVAGAPFAIPPPKWASEPSVRGTSSFCAWKSAVSRIFVTSCAAAGSSPSSSSSSSAPAS